MIELVVPHLLLLHVYSGTHSAFGGVALLLAGPVGGAGFYAAVRRYYRNADKTDRFEAETRVALKTAVTGDDQKVDEVLGTRGEQVDGENGRNFRQRVAALDQPDRPS